jgi:hypothetical protein
LLHRFQNGGSDGNITAAALPVSCPSTALVNGMPLLTGDDKHYRVIRELEIKKFRPDLF